MPLTVIGLGSNVGDREATLQEATRRISTFAPILHRSHLYETAPIGGPPQPDFLNAAVAIDWTRPPLDLLQGLQAIEQALGRVREVPNGPRTIDLDVLWIEGQTLDLPALTVPHPRLHERAFALLPLLDIVPNAIDPRTGTPFAALNLLAQSGIHRKT